MANKDLVKRAFSVTANLPSQQKPELLAAAATEVADAAEEQGVPQSEALRPLPVANPAIEVIPPGNAAPKTGPGSMMAFMAEQSEVHREVVRLRERVSEFDGAEAARRIDPRQIAVSKWANRDESHFKTESFSKLKDEIASAGGNVQPIKVRHVARPEAGAPKLEIVYGHRRHRACLELGIPVFALVQKDMKDAEKQGEQHARH